MRKKWIGFLFLLVFLGTNMGCGIVFETGSPPVTQAPVDAQPDTLPDSPVVTVAPIGEMVRVPLIALEDYGVSGPVVGCCDSLVWVDTSSITGRDPLLSAYQDLLSIRDIYYGGSGLYNALYQSDLLVATASVTDGIATIRLTGSLMMGGELDTPRVQAQLDQTALQFSEVASVQVFINDIPLADVLSLK